jgi:2-methylcitrate dehydratase PrpD
MALSERFADFTHKLQYADIPAQVLACTRTNILDSLGVMVASSIVGAGTAARDVLASVGGAEQATIVGVPKRVPAANAVLANGCLIHSLDFDDSLAPSITHPSGVVITTALAVGEMVDANAREIMTASAVGYEVMARIGAVAPGEFIKHGLHTTGITGAFVAALITARLLHLTREQTVWAQGLAGSQTAGLMEFLADGSEAKQFHSGWACHSGVMAALLAQKGLSGPRTVYEGRHGFYNAYLPHMKEKLDYSVMTDLGTHWRTPDIVYKGYPVCHLIHAQTDAIKQLSLQENFGPGDIESATCLVPEWYVDKICEPLENKRRPRTPYEARFSIPYCAAIAIIEGGLPVERFTTESIRDPDVLRLASRIGYQVEDFPEFPKAYPGGIRIRLKDGREFRQYQRFTRILTSDDIQLKFRTNVLNAMTTQVAQDVEARILKFGESGDNAGSIMAIFGRQAQQREGKSASSRLDR